MIIIVRPETHVRLGPGDPRVQQQREARLAEPARGLHRDEDVLLPESGPEAGDAAGPVSPRGWSLVEDALDQAAQAEVHVEDDGEGEDDDGQPAAEPPLMHVTVNSNQLVRTSV